MQREIESLKATCASKEDVEKQIAVSRNDVATQIQELFQFGLQRAVEQSPTIQMISRQLLKVDKVEQKVSEISIKLDEKDRPNPPLITGKAEGESNQVTNTRCTLSR